HPADRRDRRIGRSLGSGPDGPWRRRELQWWGWDIRDRDAKLGVGPRCQRQASPQAKLVDGQPALDERGLEDLDHIVAGSVGGKHVGVRSGPWIKWACHHWHLPPAQRIQRLTRRSASRHPPVV